MSAASLSAASVAFVANDNAAAAGLVITCLCVSLQLTWVFHDDEAQINKKLPKELLLRYDDRPNANDYTRGLKSALRTGRLIRGLAITHV